MYSGYFRPFSCGHLHEPVFLLPFLLTFYISATTGRFFMFVTASPVPTNAAAVFRVGHRHPTMSLSCSVVMFRTSTYRCQRCRGEVWRSKPRSSHIHIFSTGATFRRLHPDHTPRAQPSRVYLFSLFFLSQIYKAFLHLTFRYSLQ